MNNPEYIRCDYQLNDIIILLTKINEITISEITQYSAIKNPIISTQDQFIKNNYSSVDNYNENNIDKKIEDKTIELYEDKNPEIYNLEDFIPIFKNIIRILPCFLNYYTNLEKRPNKKIHTTFDKESKILGNTIIYILEYIRTICELINLSSSIKTLSIQEINFEDLRKDYLQIFEIFINENFLKTFLSDLLEYNLNNYFQILFKIIITELLNLNIAENDSFFMHLFSDLKFLDFIVENCLNNEFEFKNSKTKINVGYLPCLIEISEKINLIKLNNLILNEMVEKSKIFLNKR